MKIGITGDVNLNSNADFRSTRAHMAQRTLINVLLKNDIVPIIFPIAKPKMAKDLLDTVDGVIMTGGPDVAPDFYGEEPINSFSYRPRDEFELALIKEAIKQHKHILAICRGLQVVNVALGGTLYQDLNTQFKTDDDQPLIQHTQMTAAYFPTHHIKLKSNSEIAKSFDNDFPLVNSRHHQAAKDVAPSLHVTAKAPDGVIEGLENDDASILAVQWHPENIWKYHPEEERIFINFVEKINNDHKNN